MGRPKKIVENIVDIPKSEQPLKLSENPELMGLQESGFKTIAATEPPEKELFNIDEAADYMSVSAETIRLWIDHGHLTTQLTGGIRKIPLESMVRCRIKGRFFHTLPNKEYLRPDEVAAYFSLSVKTIYGWIDSGEIEAVNIGPGNTVRIRREEVEKMVQMKED